MRKSGRLRKTRIPPASDAELIIYLRYVVRYFPVAFTKLLAPEVARYLGEQLGLQDIPETRGSRLLSSALATAARKEGLAGNGGDLVVAYFELLGRHWPREFLKLVTKVVAQDVKEKLRARKRDARSRFAPRL
jgi:hypothetical protein